MERRWGLRRGPLGRGLALAALLATLPAGTAHASGPGTTAPWYVDQFGGDGADLKAVFAGRLGIVMARAPRPQLFVAWRLLHGLKVGETAGEALAIPCCDVQLAAASPAPPPQPAGTPALPTDKNAWLEARKRVPGASDPGYIPTERDGPDNTSVLTCYPDAFTVAAATLTDRAARFGAGSEPVKAWLAGQDAVFRACHDKGVALPPLPPAPPAWLKADRAYQAAALALYDQRFDEAAADFAAIGRGPASPWRSSALYLRARALQKAAIAAKTPTATARARAAIDALAAAPPATFGQREVADLRRILQFHTEPEALKATLDRQLSQPQPPADVAVAFRDLSDLSDGSPHPAEALDWMRTLLPRPAASADDSQTTGSQDHSDAQRDTAARTAALAHARARWTATRAPAWLLAALSLADPGAPEAAALLTDGARVAPFHPAWLTVQFHLVRLGLGGPPAAVRARLDALLARKDLSVNDRNVFTAQRMQLAETPAAFARLALRRRLCTEDAPALNAPKDPPFGCVREQWDGDDYQPSGVYDGAGAKGTVGLGEDARAVIDRLPLAERMALAEEPVLPAALRLDIALTSYGRAVQLQDDAALDRLAGRLQILLPQLKDDFARLASTRPGPDKRFAADLILAKVPGVRVDLVDYTRPEGKVSEFQQYWTDWLILPRGRGAPTLTPRPLATYQAAGYGPNDMADARTDLVCLGECGRGASPLRLPAFAAAGQARGAAERAFFWRIEGVGETPPPPPAGAVSAWDEMIAYVEAHPKDPRAAEALYWLVHVGRFGGSHDHSGRRAFKLLHARYGASVWARRSPYFYD